MGEGLKTCKCDPSVFVLLISILQFYHFDHRLRSGIGERRNTEVINIRNCHSGLGEFC